MGRRHEEGWGSSVIDRLSTDLKARFPGAKGYSPRNLRYMRTFAAAWPENSIVQAPLAELPWNHHLALPQKLDDSTLRTWCAAAAIEDERSDLAQQATRDPYLFDFLGATDGWREREVEEKLVEHVGKFLLELGLTDVDGPTYEHRSWAGPEHLLAESVHAWFDEVRTWAEIMTGQDLDPNHRVYDAEPVGHGLTFIEPANAIWPAGQHTKLGERVIEASPRRLPRQVNILREPAVAGPNHECIAAEQHPWCGIVLEDSAQEDREDVLLAD